MAVLGNKLTLMSPSRGVSMEAGAAITVLLASQCELRCLIYYSLLYPLFSSAPGPNPSCPLLSNPLPPPPSSPLRTPHPTRLPPLPHPAGRTHEPSSFALFPTLLDLRTHTDLQTVFPSRPPCASSAPPPVSVSCRVDSETSTGVHSPGLSWVGSSRSLLLVPSLVASWVSSSTPPGGRPVLPLVWL